jgi:hypothetical protein
MQNTSTRKFPHGIICLTLGAIIGAYGIYTFIGGSPILLTVGIILSAMGFMGIIFKNDVFDTSIVTVMALAAFFFGFHRVFGEKSEHHTATHSEAPAQNSEQH